MHNIALRVSLVDYPSERKLHKGNIPLVGGISIFITILIGSNLININDNLQLILYCTSAVVLIGILDDFINVDKIRLGVLALAGVKEVHAIVQEQATQIATQATQIATQATQITSQATMITTLQSQVEQLLTRLAAANIAAS